MTMGEKIRHARQSKGMTQRQVAGDRITRNMLSKIENGSATPSIKTLNYIAERLGLPSSYFLSGSSESGGGEHTAAATLHRRSRCSNSPKARRPSARTR